MYCIQFCLEWGVHKYFQKVKSWTVIQDAGKFKEKSSSANDFDTMTF